MICEELHKRGVERIGFYHGQMRPEERRRVEQEFLSGKLQVLVATKAFGMGIDVSKLGFIIHFYPPLSLEDYWQEAGRGGRGMDKEKGERCDCVVLYRPEDTEHELLKSLNLISGFSKTLSTFAAVVSGELYWNVQDQLWKAPTGQLCRLLSDLKRRGDIRQLPAIKIGETKLVHYKMLKPTQTIIQHIELFLKGEKKKKGNKGVRRLLSVLRIRAGRKDRIIRVKHSTEDSPFGLDYYDKELNWFTQPGIGALEMIDNEWDPETSEYYSQFRILKNTLSHQEMKELQQRVANYMDEKKWKFECVLFNFLGILGFEPSGPPKSVILYYLGLQDEL